MKLNYTSILTAATLMIAGANANAGVVFDPYVGATAGIGGQRFTANDKTKTHSAQSYGAIAGVDIPFLRVEAEYNYMDGEKVDIQAGLLNAYIKMPGVLVVTPYIGGGIGMVWKVDVDDSMHIGDYKESGKAIYQGMLGVTFDIPTMPFKIDVEGRVMYAPKLIDVTAMDETASGTQYDARIKLRYVF
ncbi:MAG: outer membrane beta-barrel protein [Alphaproteobacteria bacterium]|nr:outer membrane beta-barrel protein [Alphaproteobacteria bacterium]